MDKMKPILLLSLLSFLISFKIAHASLPESKPFRVVLDPGHGGSDEGAIYEMKGQRFVEKNITLNLAKVTAQAIRDLGMEAILTRTYDTEIPLQNRTAMANRLNADFFLSLHLNSGTHPDAQGIETYILNTASDAPSRRLQELENSSNSSEMDVALILKDLKLDTNRIPSYELACAVQKELVSTTQSRNRGVKQALFYVLLGADMPSALLEAGFITHANDRQKLTSHHGQLKLAQAIARGINHFRRRVTVSSCKQIKHLSPRLYTQKR